LEKAVKYEPSLAIAWRNLGWGYYHYSQDLVKAINAYEKAMSFKKDDPVYYAELDPLYEMTNTPVKKRLELFKGADEIVKKRDDSFVREMIVLNLAGEYEKAVKALNKSTFHFREGSSRVRDISVDAHLLYGIRFMKDKKFNQALEQFLSLTSDGSGSENQSDSRSPQIYYFIGRAYEALDQKKKSLSFYEKSVSQELRYTSYIKYYQGLSNLKLGNKDKAENIFNSLIEEGDKIIKQGSESDFFAKFGEREAENYRLSNAYLLKGLGYKGLGKTEEADMNLKQAVDLSASNLWANAEQE
jgi:tetratricopeptide (TPR) repeat protein